MPKMIQVRNVPSRLHAELVRRARRRGMSLTEYIEDVLERDTAHPPLEEIVARVKTRQPVPLRRSVARMIKEERARRTR